MLYVIKYTIQTLLYRFVKMALFTGVLWVVKYIIQKLCYRFCPIDFVNRGVMFCIVHDTDIVV